MIFYQVNWLWAIIPLVIAVFVVVKVQRKFFSELEAWMNSSQWLKLIPSFSKEKIKRKLTLKVLAVFLILIALARPQWGEKEELLKLTGMDILLVMDVSLSMEVEDISPSRFRKAKHWAKNFVSQLSGDRVGLIAFAGSNYLASPLTTDLAYLDEQVEILNASSISNQGTDIGSALETAFKALTRGAEQFGESEESSTQSRAIILLSDGEDHEDKAFEWAEKIKNSGIKVFIVGVGTQAGGPIPIRDELGNVRGYKKDRGGKTVVSQFNPDVLERLASTSGGKYWNISATEDEVMSILSELKGLSLGGSSTQGEKRIVKREDRFQVFLLIAAIFLFLDFFTARRKSILSLVILVWFLIPVQPIWADPYFSNEEGRKLFKEGKIAEAKRKFGEAQVELPNSSILNFNQGVVQGIEGDLDSSEMAFKKSLDSAKKEGIAELEGNALFNLGVTQGKKKDYSQAIRSYLGAIETAQRIKNKALENDARRNLELLIAQEEEEKKQQQKQDERNGEGEGDSQENSQGSSNDNSENKDDQNKDEKRKDPTQYKETSEQKRKEFKSQKLSPQAAEQVMRELSNKEKDLKQRLSRSKTKSQPLSKDW